MEKGDLFLCEVSLARAARPFAFADFDYPNHFPSIILMARRPSVRVAGAVARVQDVVFLGEQVDKENLIEARQVWRSSIS